MRVSVFIFSAIIQNEHFVSHHVTRGTFVVAVNWQAVTRPKPPKRFDTLKWAFSPCASAPRAERPTCGLSAFDAWKYARAVNEGKGRGKWARLRARYGAGAS